MKPRAVLGPVLFGLALVAGCGVTGQPEAQPGHTSTPQSRAPSSTTTASPRSEAPSNSSSVDYPQVFDVEDVDPCTFIPQSTLRKYSLEENPDQPREGPAGLGCSYSQPQDDYSVGMKILTQHDAIKNIPLNNKDDPENFEKLQMSGYPSYSVKHKDICLVSIGTAPDVIVGTGVTAHDSNSRQCEIAEDIARSVLAELKRGK